MRIHYNNGEKERIIDNVISIMVVDSHSPVVACLNNGKELTISLNNVEMILDNKVFKPTADVVEVRHGENITEMHPVDEFICSECGLIVRDCCRYEIDEDDGDEICYEFAYRYCPRCGAKMDGERREADEQR